MKKIIFAITVLTFACHFSYAQSANNTSASSTSAPTGREKMIADAKVKAELKTEKLDKELHLTQAQKNALTSIDVKYDIVAQQQKTTPENKLQLQNAKDAAIKQTLTAEQYEKYKAIAK